MIPIFFDLCNWKVDLPSTEMGKTEGRRGCEGRKQVKRIDPSFLGFASFFPSCSSNLQLCPQILQAKKTAFLLESQLPCAAWSGECPLGKSHENVSLTQCRSLFSPQTASGCLAVPSESCLMFCPEFIHNSSLWEGQSVTSHSTITDTETLSMSFWCKERRRQLKKRLKGRPHSSAPNLALDQGLANFFLEGARQ